MSARIDPRPPAWGDGWDLWIECDCGYEGDTRSRIYMDPWAPGSAWWMTGEACPECGAVAEPPARD